MVTMKNNSLSWKSKMGWVPMPTLNPPTLPSPQPRTKSQCPENSLYLACQFPGNIQSDTLSIWPDSELTLCKLPFPWAFVKNNHKTHLTSHGLKWLIAVGVNKKLTTQFKRKNGQWYVHKGLGKAPTHSWKPRRPHTRVELGTFPELCTCSPKTWEGQRISCLWLTLTLCVCRSES